MATGKRIAVHAQISLNHANHPIEGASFAQPHRVFSRQCVRRALRGKSKKKDVGNHVGDNTGVHYLAEAVSVSTRVEYPAHKDELYEIGEIAHVEHFRKNR